MGVSAHVQQSVCNSPAQLSDQHEANAENHTQLPYHAHFNDTLNTLHGLMMQMT